MSSTTKPCGIVRLWRRATYWLFHKSPDDFESPFETILAGIAVWVVIIVFALILGMIGHWL